MEVLGTNKEGHCVYGDPSVPQHTFVDTAPHAKHIGPSCYAKAKQTAAKIREAGGLIEHFAPAPLSYQPFYMYYGVHNTYCADGNACHEVVVPGVDSVVGAGDDLDEALREAQIKMTVVLRDMQQMGTPMPKLLPRESVEAIGRAQDRNNIADCAICFCGTVDVSTLPTTPQLSHDDWVAVDSEVRKAWREVTNEGVGAINI
jgi:predicted RNase H-like HicB family nuclease